MWLIVYGLGSRVWGLGFGVKGRTFAPGVAVREVRRGARVLATKSWGSWSRFRPTRFRVWGLGFRV